MKLYISIEQIKSARSAISVTLSNGDNYTQVDDHERVLLPRMRNHVRGRDVSKGFAFSLGCSTQITGLNSPPIDQDNILRFLIIIHAIVRLKPTLWCSD